jgi:hypothetical protein
MHLTVFLIWVAGGYNALSHLTTYRVLVYLVLVTKEVNKVWVYKDAGMGFDALVYVALNICFGNCPFCVFAYQKQHSVSIQLVANFTLVVTANTAVVVPVLCDKNPWV